MAGKKFGELNAATEAKSDDLYAVRQDRGGGVHETRKLTGELIFQWIRNRLNISTDNDADTLARRTAQGRIKAADPSASDDVGTKGWSDGRFVAKAALGKTGGLTVQNAAHADHASTAGHATTAGSATSASNANTVGGLTAGQIARRDSGNTFAGAIKAIGSVNVLEEDPGDNTHYWFRNHNDNAVGLLYRHAATGAITLRRYKSPGGDYEEASLLSGGIFDAPAFRGDGSRLTNIPMAFAPNASWKNVTPSRSSGTTYVNNTGYMIQIAVQQSKASGVEVSVSVDGMQIQRQNPSHDIHTRIASVSTIVPAGSSYSYGWHEGGGVYVREFRA